MSKHIYTTILTIVLAFFGAFMVPVSASADEGTANGSGITVGHGEFEGVIGEPLEDVIDETDISPKVTMSWPKGVETTRVAVTVDNRHGAKTYRANIRTVLVAGNDVFASPSEASDSLVGIDRTVKVRAGKVKTYELFTYQAVTWHSGTVTRAKGAKMTDLNDHQRIKRYRGLALDSVIKMEAWPTRPNGQDITNVMCPAWLAYPNTWGWSCYM